MAAFGFCTCPAPLNTALEGPGTITNTAFMPATKEQIAFVVHGRNEQIRDAAFALLRSLGLKPIEWSQAIAMSGSGTPYVGNVIANGLASAQAVVVLLTGDDHAYLRTELQRPDDPDSERWPTPQPRQNVLFEAGLAFGLHPERTVLLSFGSLRTVSDLSGRHVIHMDNSLPKRQEVANRLRTAGCEVDTTGADWHKAGDFSIPKAPSGETSESASSTDASTLSTDQERVLLLLRDRDGQEIWISHLESLLEWTPTKTKFVTTDLVDKGLLRTRTLQRYGPPSYHLTQKGRAYLHARGLLD
jgi:predicted nucleotide-binding protein